MRGQDSHAIHHEKNSRIVHWLESAFQDAYLLSLDPPSLYSLLPSTLVPEMMAGAQRGRMNLDVKHFEVEWAVETVKSAMPSEGVKPS